jgi:hypothetical protein
LRSDAITAAVGQAVEPLTVELRRLTDEVAGE